jgi:hypothetical protein
MTRAYGSQGFEVYINSGLKFAARNDTSPDRNRGTPKALLSSMSASVSKVSWTLT